MITTTLGPEGSAVLCANFVDLLQHWTERQPHKVAFRFLRRGEVETDQLTYATLDQRARAIAATLQAQHVPGDRALLLYPPGLDFITAFLGCLYGGLIAVPAYPPRPNQKLLRLQAIIEDSQAQVVLTNGSFWKQKEQWLLQEPQWTSMQWLNTDAVGLENSSHWVTPLLTADTLAFLQYTSGSTGNPKGVMISHGNLMHNSAAIQRCFQNTSQSRGVTWLPPYHDMGLIGGILQPIFVGAEMAIMSPVDFLQKPLRWLTSIARYQATTSGAPNFAYELCIQKFKPEQLADLDLRSWTVAFTGAEPVRAETLDQFASLFEPFGFRREAFYPCYGMAETTLIATGGAIQAPPVVEVVATAPLEHHCVLPVQDTRSTTSRRLVGCGQSLPDQTVVIVNPETHRPCQADEVGEVWIAGPSVAQGYWRSPCETQRCFKAHLADTGVGPFLRTGDLGFLRDGELFITGRIKDIVIIRGQNYYPQDIELTVEQSHPALRANGGAVFSAEIDQAERLIIVHEVEREYLRNLKASEVVADIRQAVTTQHGLQTYAIALLKPGSIPKTSSGKIRRHACRAGFLGGSLNVVEDWSENPQYKAEFVSLQTETSLLLENLQSLSS